MTPEVADPLAERLYGDDPKERSLGRALLWAACLAGLGGARPEAIEASGALRVATPEGSLLLAPLVLQTERHPRGRPEVVHRLIRALEQGFAGRRFALAIRRPVAPDFDPEAVSRAVQLWLMAVDRGEWRGRHAIYDDDHVAVELTLLDAVPTEPGRALTFLVGPSSSLERLGVLDGHLQAIARLHLDSGLPLVGVLVGDPRWGIARGYAGQLLYGTPDEVRGQCGEGASLRAAYLHEGFSLFADAQFRRLAALWWLEPMPGDPLGVQGFAHENPWALAAGQVPSFPGARFARVAQPDGVQRRGDRAWMAWVGRGPTVWRS